MNKKPLFLPDYNQEPLIEHIPDYMANGLERWLESFLRATDFIPNSPPNNKNSSNPVIGKGWLGFLCMKLRISPRFSEYLQNFCEQVIYSDSDRAFQIIQWLITTFSDENLSPHQSHKNMLEGILKICGSAYTVGKYKSKNGSRTGFCLQHRVPKIIDKISKLALSQEELLEEAWGYCYAKDPDFLKSVQACCSFLEDFLKNKYFPDDHKSRFGDWVKTLQDKTKPQTKRLLTNIKGSDVFQLPESLMGLIAKIPIYRGMHIKTGGKIPSQSEAEYILHTTIYFWNLHKKK